jgi:hypothetical protein
MTIGPPRGRISVLNSSGAVLAVADECLMAKMPGGSIARSVRLGDWVVDGRGAVVSDRPVEMDIHPRPFATDGLLHIELTWSRS